MRLNHLIIIGALCGALLLPSSASSWGVVGLSAGGGGSCTESCGDYLVCQNFEGTGYDNSESWTESVGSGGSANEDDTTATVGRGEQQLRLVAGNAGANTTDYMGFDSQQGHVWAHVKFRTTDGTPGYDSLIFALYESTNPRMTVYLDTSGVVQLYSGGTLIGSTTTTISNSTWYHIWIHFYPGTGASDGIAALYISTSNTRPESPEVTSSAVNNYHWITRIYLVASQNTGVSFIATNDFDQVYVDNAEITNVCP